MHDCPNCRVPLHGHEEVCPSCGSRQAGYARRSSSSLFETQREPSINYIPIVVAFVVLLVGLGFIVQSSWIGQLMNRAPVQEEPWDKMTPLEARQFIQTKIGDGLTAVSAKGKFSWENPDGSPADITAAGPVQLSITTKLSDKEQRKAIIDPVKDYMAKANIPTLTMSDTKSGATWTYTVSTPITQPDTGEPPADGEAQPPSDQSQAPQDTNTESQ